MSLESVPSPEQVATIDALTGLPNRAGLEKTLDRDIAYSSGDFALVFADIDGLKHTNDTLGHAAGDSLIVETGQILEKGLRSDHLSDNDGRAADLLSRGVYRLGGDEFVIKLAGVKTQDEVDAVTARLQDTLLSEGSNGGIRISMAGRVHRAGESGKELLADVDRMMYDKKRARKNEEKKLEQQAHREHLMKLPIRKFWVHVGGVVVKRATEKYSGVKDPR